MWLAGFSAEFLLSQPKLNKKFGWGVYYNVVYFSCYCLSSQVSIHSLRMLWISLISFGYIEVDFVVSEWISWISLFRQTHINNQIFFQKRMSRSIVNVDKFSINFFLFLCELWAMLVHLFNNAAFSSVQTVCAATRLRVLPFSNKVSMHAWFIVWFKSKTGPK